MADAKLMQKKSFIRGGEGTIASYSFSDVEDGVAYVNLYGGTTVGAAVAGVTTIGYRLSKEAVQAPFRKTSRLNTAGTTQIDFDTSTFNLPKVAKGTAYVYFSYNYNGAGDSGDYFLIQVKKVAGATETNLSSELKYTPTTTNNVLAGWSSGAVGEVLYALPLTQTIIKKGEFLRLTIKLTILANKELVLWHDPVNRDPPVAPDEFSRALRLFMPFRVDL